MNGLPSPLLEYARDSLEREPALLLALRFEVESQRSGLLGAALILRELTQIAIGSSDTRVAEAKLGWWHDEAQRWSIDQPRHPLAVAFDAAEAAPTLGVLIGETSRWLSSPSPSDLDALQRLLSPAAAALADLAGGGDIDAWRRVTTIGVLRQPPGAALGFNALPLDVIARHGLRRGAPRDAAMADVARSMATLPLPPIARLGLRAWLLAEQRFLARLAGGESPEAITLRRRDVFAIWWGMLR